MIRFSSSSEPVLVASGTVRLPGALELPPRGRGDVIFAAASCGTLAYFQ